MIIINIIINIIVLIYWFYLNPLNTKFMLKLGLISVILSSAGLILELYRL